MNIQPYIDAFPLPAKRGILSDINKENTEKAIAEAMKNPATVAAEIIATLRLDFAFVSLVVPWFVSLILK